MSFATITTTPTCDDFLILSQDVMNSRQRKKNGSFLTMDRRFWSLFGVAPPVCVELWYHIDASNTIDHKGYWPVHLLWTLYFMKGYDTEEKCCSFWMR